MLLSTKKMSKGISLLSAAIFFPLLGTSAQACVVSDSVYIGTVCFTANLYCPRDYAEASGQLLSINDNTALYSLLGTTYGGDAKTNFRLPDLRGRTAVGIGTGPGLTPVMQGQMRGQESIVQNILQMPPHTHTAAVSGGGPVDVSLSAKVVSGQNTPASGYMLGAGGAGQGSANIYVAPSTPGDTVELGGVAVSGGAPVAVTIGNTGGGQQMHTVPPQLGLRACIATQGVYPPRP